jgi:UDP-N-acetylmuramate--alanine ligase
MRQHEIKNDYKYAFAQIQKLYWLPTYLSRENPDLPVLTPEELIASLDNPSLAEPAEMNDELWERITEAREHGSLVLCMSAGTLDGWLRGQLAAS